jgi:hypothetical protein
MAGVLKKQGETYTNSRLGATALNATIRPIGTISG